MKPQIPENWVISRSYLNHHNTAITARLTITKASPPATSNPAPPATIETAVGIELALALPVAVTVVAAVVLGEFCVAGAPVQTVCLAVALPVMLPGVGLALPFEEK